MSAIDYESRKKPAVYKPLIDTELQKIAEIAGADAGAVQAELDAVDLEGRGPWGYLTAAAKATTDLLFTDEVRRKLAGNWAAALWEPPQQYTCYGGPTEDDVERDPDDYETNYIVAEYYPEESHEALAQDNYWAGADADVMGIWQKDGIAKVFHAHMEGFWILGEDPVDFIQKAVAKMK